MWFACRPLQNNLQNDLNAEFWNSLQTAEWGARNARRAAKWNVQALSSQSRFGTESVVQIKKRDRTVRDLWRVRRRFCALEIWISVRIPANRFCRKSASLQNCKFKIKKHSIQIRADRRRVCLNTSEVDRVVLRDPNWNNSSRFKSLESLQNVQRPHLASCWTYQLDAWALPNSVTMRLRKKPAKKCEKVSSQAFRSFPRRFPVRKIGKT